MEIKWRKYVFIILSMMLVTVTMAVTPATAATTGSVVFSSATESNP